MQPEQTRLQLDRSRALRDAGLWFMLAVGSLLVAGTLAVVLVIGRLPGLAEIVISDVMFARRSLVVHVNLALEVWFFSFLAGMFCLLPGAPRVRAAGFAMPLAALGTALFCSAMFLPDATPVLSNYIPALDHWLFLLGLGLFGAGVALNFVDPRLLPGRHGQPLLPAPATSGVRAGAFAYLLACLTIAAAWQTQDEGLYRALESGAPHGFYERLFWGGGHLLQYANVLGMTGCWMLLLHRLLGRSPVAPRGAAVLFALLMAPTLAGPLIVSAESSWTLFTRLMQFGIFPVTAILIALCAVAVRRTPLPPGALKDPAFTGFATSAVMTVLGFLLGASISEQTTLIPAHYHTSIGAVTATYMAVILTLLPEFGAPLPTARLKRLAAWQPVLFGIGQTVFAGGLALAGTWGKAERKVYGKEQVVRTTGEWVGLIVMGTGGVIALAGGILLLVLLVKALRARKKAA